ncbi:hypothetical protein G6F44_008868 [Rhizopus delemar]|nr:hypothetical protein G6F44_008868 [Rhizopus delemar]
MSNVKNIDNTDIPIDNNTNVTDNSTELLNESDTDEISDTDLCVEERIKTLFELPSVDKLVNRFSCYIIGTVTLPGWVYITNQHICFYATLPRKKKGPHKTGYLTKKNHVTSPRSFRYYFELSGHVLSWYESTESKYLPLNSIDLVNVVHLEPCKTKKFGIRLRTDSERILLIADSQVSYKEWLDELRKGVFLAQHTGNHMRIVLPLNKIIAIDKPLVFQFAENIKVRIASGNNSEDVNDDINAAYNCIMDVWKQVPNMETLDRRQEASVTSSSFFSLDGLINNISPAALPAIFMNRFINHHQNDESDHDSSSQASGDQSSQALTATRHRRSSSLSALRHYITPSYIYNRLSWSQDLLSVDTVSRRFVRKLRHPGEPSLGSSLLLNINRPWSFISDYLQTNEAWFSSSLANSLSKKYNVSIKQEKSQDEWEKEQAEINGHLNNQFPMLLNIENVEAVFKCSVWRTLPHHGKMYITNQHLCFQAKVAVGKQKLIIPWSDVLQINKTKTKSHYLLCGLTMTVKNITDVLYFDFSSIELRDQCYYVCQLKSNEIIDVSSVLSKESFIRWGDDIDGPHPINLPDEYNGPPLLSPSSNYTNSSKKTPDRPLHITCLTIGSRGDVQPYLALCKELKKDGHTCRIATHPEYQEWVEEYGLEFKSIGGDPGDLMKLCIDNSFLSVSFIRDGTKFFYSWFENLLMSSYEACQGTDVLIESPSAMVGIHIAEKLAYFRSMPFPFSRTGKFPHPFAFQSTAGGRIYNDMTYVMIDMALWVGTARYVNRFRRNTLQLPSTTLDRLRLDKVPYLYSFSSSVIHPPKDWPDYIHCTGYWFLENSKEWTPPNDMVEFLAYKDTRPIVYIGFGSIIVPDPGETTRTIVQAVLKSNVRAIICKGWSNRHKDDDSSSLLDQHTGTIYHCESVPHDWLFEKIQGVVHHGGAGTTAAGLRAGLPTIIKPFFGDQRFWGQRVEELQIGICITKLTKNSLTEALKTITQNEAMIAKAQVIGETIRKENGTRTAVECIYRDIEYAKQLRCEEKKNNQTILSDDDTED